jgi:hypothetical protein
VTKSDEVLALARRLVALEAEAAALRAELDALVGEGERSAPAGPRTKGGTAPRGRSTPDGGVVQAVVLRLVLAQPTRSFRAGDLRSLLPGQPGKNSVESALQRLVGAGLLERAGRGLYQAPGRPEAR